MTKNDFETESNSRKESAINNMEPVNQYFSRQQVLHANDHISKI